jgi:hypothetical protein
VPSGFSTPLVTYIDVHISANGACPLRPLDARGSLATLSDVDRSGVARGWEHVGTDARARRTAPGMVVRMNEYSSQRTLEATREEDARCRS